MDDSILNTIKKSLDVELDYTGFDSTIILGINAALMDLNQLGIGPTDGFIVVGQGETWEDFIGTSKKLEAVKTYVQLKTKMFFDPPTTSFVLEAMTRQIQEQAVRLMIQVDPLIPDPVEPEC